MPKEDSQYICLSVILIDSVFRTGKNYYLQVLLEECKYVVKKKKKIPKYIIDDIEISSDSHKNILVKKVLIEKILTKKILIEKILMKKILIKKLPMRKI